MRAQPVHEQALDSYNRFVADSGGVFLQSHEWGAWQQHNQRASAAYMAYGNTGEVLASAQFIRHRLPLGQYYLYCPYGPVCSRGAQPADYSAALEALMREVRANYSSALFVKLEPTVPLPPLARTTAAAERSRHIQPGSTLQLDLTKTDEQLLAEMHQKNRYNIRVAERSGVTVRAVTDAGSEDARQAIQLISETTERHAYRGHPASYYARLLAFFGLPVQQQAPHKLCWRLLIAEHKGVLLTAGIFADFGTTRTYVFGGSSEAYREVMGSFQLQWQAMRGAKQAGKAIYDLGGLETSGGGTPGFVRFKLRFGGTPMEYPPPTDLTWHRTGYNAYRFAKKLLR